jgi:hypothetical protein
MLTQSLGLLSRAGHLNAADELIRVPPLPLLAALMA